MYFKFLSKVKKQRLSTSEASCHLFFHREIILPKTNAHYRYSKWTFDRVYGGYASLSYYRVGYMVLACTSLAGVEFKPPHETRGQGAYNRAEGQHRAERQRISAEGLTGWVYECLDRDRGCGIFAYPLSGSLKRRSGRKDDRLLPWRRRGFPPAEEEGDMMPFGGWYI